MQVIFAVTAQKSAFLETAGENSQKLKIPCSKPSSEEKSSR